MSGSLTALTVGHLTRDLYDDGPAPGGGAWYVAHAWAALGVFPWAVVAAAPDDVAGWPGEVVTQPCAQTTTFRNTYTPAGRAMRLEHQAPQIEVSALPDRWRRCDLLLLAPVAGELDPTAWLAAVDARVRGAGLQGWLKARTPEGRFVPRPRDLDPRRLRGLDVACLSDEDIGGDTAWLEALRAVVPRVALTHGAEGCTVFEGAAARRVAAPPATEVDPTGAGDTFAAGLMVALARGEPLASAAASGCALAARSVEARGPLRPA